MDKADYLKFFDAERKFLARTVDLRRILAVEGWKAVGSVLNGVSRFHHKGRIVEVHFHKGADAFQWQDDLGQSGSALDLLKDEKIADHKQRFMAALDKLRKYSKRFHPDATQQFYDRHKAIVHTLRSRNQAVEVNPYQQLENQFLIKEVSIFKVAHALGYKPSPESRSGKTYFRKIGLAASFRRSEDGVYLWYDHEQKKGGTILDFVAFDQGINGEAAYERLKGFAMEFVFPEKLETFMVEAFAIRAEKFPEGSLATLIENQSTGVSHENRSALHERDISDFMQAYESQAIFKSWSVPALYEDILPRHFRMPDLNPAFRRISGAIGNDKAQELARIALIKLTAAKLVPECLEQVLSQPELKTGTRTMLNAINGMRVNKGPGDPHHAILSILEQFQIRPVQADSKQSREVGEKPPGLSL